MNAINSMSGVSFGRKMRQRLNLKRGRKENGFKLENSTWNYQLGKDGGEPLVFWEFGY